jgi:hypothetical protein
MQGLNFLFKVIVFTAIGISVAFFYKKNHNTYFKSGDCIRYAQINEGVDFVIDSVQGNNYQLIAYFQSRYIKLDNNPPYSDKKYLESFYVKTTCPNVMSLNVEVGRDPLEMIRITLMRLDNKSNQH